MTSISIADRQDGIAVLTIDQPGSKANVLTSSLWEELEQAVDSLGSRSGLIIASAKPGIFIAGADLKLLGSAPGPNDPAVEAFMRLGSRVLKKLSNLHFPTGAAIDGAALGGGLEVALACDFRFATPSPHTRLALPEVTLGLIPGWGGTQRLPRLIGSITAADLIISARSVSVDEAVVMGLVDAAVAASELIPHLAACLLGSSNWRDRRGQRNQPMADRDLAPLSDGNQPIAQQSVASVMAKGAGLGLDEALEVEAESFLRLAGSSESRGLIAQFFASRKK